jgi:hypothetical protein
LKHLKLIHKLFKRKPLELWFFLDDVTLKFTLSTISGQVETYIPLTLKEQTFKVRKITAVTQLFPEEAESE